jgi:predicted outer membrane repeat protein
MDYISLEIKIRGINTSLCKWGAQCNLSPRREVFIRVKGQKFVGLDKTPKTCLYALKHLRGRTFEGTNIPCFGSNVCKCCSGAAIYCKIFVPPEFYTFEQLLD